MYETFPTHFLCLCPLSPALLLLLNRGIYNKVLFFFQADFKRPLSVHTLTQAAVNHRKVLLSKAACSAIVPDPVKG